MTDNAQPRTDPLMGVHPASRMRQIEAWRWVALACTLALIVGGLTWELWLAPLRGGTGALAIKVLPLTLALAGLLKHKLYTYRWLSLLVWLYFTEGIVRGTTESGMSQMLALAEIGLSTLLFVACAVYVRLRLKVLPPKDKRAPEAAQA